jgi:hypothetical protein
MGSARRNAHRGRIGRLSLVVAVSAILLCVPAGASAKHPKLPGVPRCGSFSAKKVSDVLRSGRRMYLQHTLADGTSCTYYGLTVKQADELTNTFVPYNQIIYYPSLLISAVETTGRLFNFQLRLLEKQGYERSYVLATDPWRIGSDELFFHGTQAGDKQQECTANPMIMYDNWVGPPDCKGQPALDQVQVLAWIPKQRGSGLMILLSASNQEGHPLSIGHMLDLAKKTTTGALH